MLFYLSFVGEEAFRGAAFVPAPDMIAAVKEAHRRKINPGGEVMMVEVERPIPEKWVGRLLSRAELAQLEVELAAMLH